MAPTTESRLNVEDLSKKELLLLLSVLEGELEARDFVIQTLRAQNRDSYMWERYGKYSLNDPFLALQRDGEVLQDSGRGSGDGGSSSQRRQGICGAAAAARADPLAVLKLVVGHCRRMQEKMLKQLAAAESRHRRIIADLEEEKRKHAEDAAEGDDVTYILEKERERLLQQLEFEKAKTSRIEREKKRLHDQLEDQRVQQKHLMTALSRECKRSGSRAHEESQRATELCHRLERERSASQALKAELEEEKKRAMQMEARREELLAEFDTEREQLGLRLRKEEARCRELQEERERLRRQMSAGKMNGHHVPTEEDVRVDVLENQSSSSTENTMTNGSSPSDPQAGSPSAINTECSLQSTILTQSPDMSSVQAVYQAGINQRFHAARHKFQGTLDEDIPDSPPPCDTNAISPTDGVSSKHAARYTVTQALNRFGAHQGSSKPAGSNTSPFGTDYRTLSQSGVMSPTIRSPTIPRAERGTPPPIPPKKPGLAETPPSPASHRAARLAQMTAGCGRSSSHENSKEPDFVLSSSG